MQTLMKLLAEQVTRLTLENIELKSIVEDLKTELANKSEESCNNENN